MIVFDTHWEKKSYSTLSKIIFSAVYTISFATLFFKLFFPFDLFLLNMFLVQLPLVHLTGKTLHGFLSGMVTVTQV